jgi:hypothetical protein
MSVSARDGQGVRWKDWSGMLLLSRRRIGGILVSKVEPIDQFRYAMRWWTGGARGAIPARFGWLFFFWLLQVSKFQLKVNIFQTCKQKCKHSQYQININRFIRKYSFSKYLFDIVDIYIFCTNLVKFRRC